MGRLSRKLAVGNERKPVDKSGPHRAILVIPLYLCFLLGVWDCGKSIVPKKLDPVWPGHLWLFARATGEELLDSCQVARIFAGIAAQNLDPGRIADLGLHSLQVLEEFRVGRDPVDALRG